MDLQSRANLESLGLHAYHSTAPRIRSGTAVHAGTDLRMDTIALVRQIAEALEELPSMRSLARVVLQIIDIPRELKAKKKRCEKIIAAVCQNSYMLFRSLELVAIFPSSVNVASLNADLVVYKQLLEEIFEGLITYTDDSFAAIWDRFISKAKGVSELARVRKLLAIFQQGFTHTRLTTIESKVTKALFKSRSAESRDALQEFPPSPILVVGRDDAIEQIVDSAIHTTQSCISILGPEGVGKTTVASQIFHHPAIQQSYPIKFFVSCESSTTAEHLFMSLAVALAIPEELRNTNPEALVIHLLESLTFNTLLCLDNLETTWNDPVQRPSVDALLGKLSNINDTLTLVVTMRGTQSPATSVVQWRQIYLEGLDLAGSVKLFESLAGQTPDKDSLFLLEEFNGIPLAIALFARLVAEGHEPAYLLRQWHFDKAANIQHNVSPIGHNVHLDDTYDFGGSYQRRFAGLDNLADLYNAIDFFRTFHYQMHREKSDQYEDIVFTPEDLYLPDFRSDFQDGFQNTLKLKNSGRIEDVSPLDYTKNSDFSNSIPYESLSIQEETRRLSTPGRFADVESRSSKADSDALSIDLTLTLRPESIYLDENRRPQQRRDFRNPRIPVEAQSSVLNDPNDEELRSPAMASSDPIRAQILNYLHHPKLCTEDSILDVISKVTKEQAPELMSNMEQVLQASALTAKRQRRIHRIIRMLAVHHNVLPSSFAINNVIRDGEHPIAGGGYADVYKGTINGELVCLKVLKTYLDYKKSEEMKVADAFLKEPLIWRQFNHPNLLPFLGISLDSFPGRLCFVSPFMARRDIMRFIRDEPHVDRMRALFQVADGLHYLHEIDVCHGDVKGANILMDDSDNCCLADFGISSVVASQTATLTTASADYTKGTLRWMAPELIFPDRFPSRAKHTSRDVYAFGCTMLEVCTGLHPFASSVDTQVMFLVCEGKRPPRPIVECISDDVWNLIERCWAQDAAKRPSSGDILLAFKAFASYLSCSLD